MNIYILIIGAIIGFSLAKIFSGKKEGVNGHLKSCKFTIGKYVIHLHHWFVALAILIILFMVDFYNNFIYGFLFGLIVQGLSYRDFYKIIYLRK